QILKDATLFFSSDEPTLAEVIPAMDNIDSAFTDFIIEDTEIHLSDIIKSSVTIAKQTLNKYYNLMDDSEVYRISLILHPEHKFDYFKKHSWPEDWIDDA
ncbi:hypothetical protein BDZ89DRAFT_897014, partial [Hymenopellis radicata]